MSSSRLTIPLLVAFAVAVQLKFGSTANCGYMSTEVTSAALLGNYKAMALENLIGTNVDASSTTIQAMVSTAIGAAAATAFVTQVELDANDMMTIDPGALGSADACCICLHAAGTPTVGTTLGCSTFLCSTSGDSTCIACSSGVTYTISGPANYTELAFDSLLTTLQANSGAYMTTFMELFHFGTAEPTHWTHVQNHLETKLTNIAAGSIDVTALVTTLNGLGSIPQGTNPIGMQCLCGDGATYTSDPTTCAGTSVVAQYNSTCAASTGGTRWFKSFGIF